MKKSLLRTILFPVICCLCVHCTQNSTDQILPQEMNDRQLLEFLGYDTRTMIERDDYYLLAPNTVILKEDIPELRNNPQTRMQRGYGLLSEEYQTIYLNDDGISDYADLLAQAVEEWNKISNSNIKFVFDNTASLAVNFVGDGGGDIFDPVSIQNPSSNGQYGKTVVLNYAKALPLLSEPTRGKYFMMHILGHIVGFGHAVVDPFAMPDGNHINGTTVSDTESIMRSENDILNGRNGEKWTGFSEWDIKAVQFLYPPKEKPSFTFDCVPAGTGTDGLTLAMGSTYTFTAKYVFSSCPNPKYQITVKKTSGLGASEYELHETGNGIYTIKFTKGGDYKISVKVTNATQSNLIERTYSVTEFAVTKITCTPEGEGPDKNKLITFTPYVFTAFYSHSACPNPEYEIKINQTTGYELKKLENGKISVTFSKPGTYKVVVRITNRLISTQFEKTYIVTDPTKTNITCSPEGDGPDKNTLLTLNNYLFTAFYSHPKCLNPRYEISIDKSSGYMLENVGNGKISVLFSKAGTYTISVNIPNAPVPTQFEKTYIVTDPGTFSIRCLPEADGIDENELTTNQAYTIHTSYSHPVCPNPNYEISIENGNKYNLLHVRNGLAILNMTKTGICKMIVKITNAPIPIQFEKIYYVYNPPVTDIICSPDGKGKDKNRLILNRNYTFIASYLHQACSNPQYDLSVYRQTESGLINGIDNRPSIKYYDLINIGNGIISVKFIVPGTYKIIAKVTNLKKPYQFEKTYIVPEQDSRVRISGPTKVNTWDDFEFNISYRNLDYPNPEFIITVTETTFNDPQYTLQQINNNTVSIFFAEPGNYVIEASIKDAPEINIGKYFVPAFDELTYELQEPVIVNTIDNLNEYATEAPLTNNLGDPYLQTRIVYYAHIKTDGYRIDKKGHRIKILTGTKTEKKFIAMRTDIVGVLQLPNLKEEPLNDPFVGKLIISPYYEKITFPDNICREYDPAIDD